MTQVLYTRSLAFTYSNSVKLGSTVIGFAGYEMPGGQQYGRFHSTPIDRDMLILPDVLLEDWDVDLPEMLRPIFDAVWNAAGWERSMNYDEHGRWAKAKSWS